MRSATYEGLAGVTGLPRSVLNTMIENLSEGQTGLIVPGYVYPIQHGKAAPRQCGMARLADSQVWEPTVKKVHQNGSKIIFQVCHGGVRCNPEDIKLPQAIGVSPEGPNTREMTNAEIEETIDSFIQAAFRIQSIGGDGIQLHAAHGYLLSAFLSPVMNKRTDKWGGSFENRLRIVHEIATQIKEVVAPDFAIGIKMNGDDNRPGGVTPELAAQYISKLRMIDFFEISCGLGGCPSYGIRSDFNEEFFRQKVKNEAVVENAKKMIEGVKYEEGYNVYAAKIIHRIVPDAKLAVVGGNRNIKNMEKLITDGTVQLISMSRPFLRQPHLVKDLKEGKIDKIDCVSCGLCNLHRLKGIKCQNYD